MNNKSEKHGPVLKKAHELKRKNKTRLMNKANVTGVGVGYKIKNGKRTNQVSIRVYVSKKLPKEKLSPRDLLPKKIENIPVDVIEAKFEVVLDPSIPANHRLRFDPLLGGISIGNSILGGSGTLGVSVFDNVLGEDMMLSNWHVLCGRLACASGEPVIQPGSGPGDAAGPVVGTLYRAAMTNQVDGAIARLSGDRFLLKELFGWGHVSSVATPVLGMAVRKSGRTTGITSGVITDIDADISITYPDGVNRSLQNQVMIEGTLASRPGDSGSIWIDDSNNAVGLNFARSGNMGVANPMPEVLSALNINFRFGITMHDFVAITANTLL